MRPSQIGTSSLDIMGAMRVGEEVRSVNTENLLDGNFRPGPGWHWQSGKCIKNIVLMMITGEDALMEDLTTKSIPVGFFPRKKAV